MVKFLFALNIVSPLQLRPKKKIK